MIVNRFANKKHPGGAGRPMGRAILIFAALSVLLAGLAGCTRPETNPPGQTTVTPTTTAQATQIQTSASQSTIQTTSKPTTGPTTGSQTTTGSQIAPPARFSPADLTVNGIPVGATPQEAEQVLGAPKQSTPDIDQVSGLDVLTYTYDDLQMIFMKGAKTDADFHLRYVEVTGSGFELARGFKVGDTASSVYQRFYRDKTTTDYKGYTVLYGDPNLLDRQDTTGEIAFAYFDEREAHYLFMKPPYMTGSATIYDEMAMLRLTIDNQIITQIFWMLGAGAE